MEYLEFIETPVFSRRRAELLPDDDFRALQEHLLKNHDLGDTISKTGGCKKIRWSREGMGKRGGSKSYLLRYNQIGTPLSATGLSQKRKRRSD